MFERDKEDLRALGIPIEVGGYDPLFDDEQGYRIRAGRVRAAGDRRWSPTRRPSSDWPPGSGSTRGWPRPPRRAAQAQGGRRGRRPGGRWTSSSRRSRPTNRPSRPSGRGSHPRPVRFRYRTAPRHGPRRVACSPGASCRSARAGTSSATTSTGTPPGCSACRGWPETWRIDGRRPGPSRCRPRRHPAGRLSRRRTPPSAPRSCGSDPGERWRCASAGAPATEVAGGWERLEVGFVHAVVPRGRDRVVRRRRRTSRSPTTSGRSSYVDWAAAPRQVRHERRHRRRRPGPGQPAAGPRAVIQRRGAMSLEDAAHDFGVPSEDAPRGPPRADLLRLAGLDAGDLIEVDLEALDGDDVIRISNADYLARRCGWRPAGGRDHRGAADPARVGGHTLSSPTAPWPRSRTPRRTGGCPPGRSTCTSRRRGREAAVRDRLTEAITAGARSGSPTGRRGTS